jgi:LacI family transcriptional regulator
MKRTWRLLVVGAESHYGRQIVKGILAYCRVHGSWEFHLEADSNLKGMRRSQQAIRQWKADGIIARVHSLHVERMIKDYGLPVVNISSARNTDLPTVVADSTAIGKMAARYFLDNRFQNLAFCARTAEVYAQQRCDGFVREATKAGLSCEVFIDSGSNNEEPEWVNNRRKLDPWLLSLKKPVGVMCVHDPRAQEVVAACRRLGLRVPHDVAIVGAGNEESLCLMYVPPLSSVDYQTERIGYEAARLMDRMLHGAKPPSKPVWVPPHAVVVRQSSDMIPIDDAETIAAMRFIREHAHEPVTIKHLLEQVPICRRSLEYRFVRILGRTPKAEFMRLRLQRAQDLLEHTDLPVKAVVTRSGYTSDRVFRSFFCRQTGMTPTQYRHKFRITGPATKGCQLQRP